jgi:chemotaxis protein histidine kinase CheA/ActR/RegA family two-component response regulator
MEQQDRILGYFLEEADQHLDTIEQGLRKLSETVRQPEMIRELFRAAHSIVGSAAMLGLTDVQQIGKQFEANFKLLKEQPIVVDNRLQSLFLESFAFLRAAIVEVKTSSDPYHPDPNSLPPVGDPVFEELKSYLQNLLAQIDSPTPAPIERESTLSQDPAIEQVFGEYVTRKLHELQELCLQPDRSETRAQIQQICQKLGNLGENFEFLEWTNLFAACRLATANPLNSLHELGESIVIAVKQSQILILSDRHQAVSITPDLQSLIDRKNSADLDISKDTSTFKLNSLTDPIVNPDLNLLGQNQDLQSLKIISNLDSIDEGATDRDFDNNFADWTLNSDSEVNADLELEEFINLLGEDLPVEGTWMQDEDISDDTLNRSDFGNLEIDPTPAVELVSLQSDPLPSIDIDKASTIDIELPIGQVDYDEDTYYDPDLEDMALATFWSETDIDENNPSLNRLEDLDFIDNNSHQLQPEHPPTQDFDIAAPDFAVDSPMSELFPPAVTLDNFEVEELQPELAIEPVGSIDLQIAPMTIDLTPDPLFFEDFDSFEFPSSGESSVEEKLVESIDNSLEPQQLDDFAGINLDSVENLDSMNSISTDSDLDDLSLVEIENLDSITDTAIHRDFIDLNLGSIDNSRSIANPVIDSPQEKLRQGDFSDFNLENGDSLDLFVDPSVDSNYTDFKLQEVNELNLFTDSSTDSSSSESKLQDINNLDSSINSTIDSSFTDFDFEDSNSLDLGAAPIVDNSFADLDLANSNNLDLVEDLTIDSGFVQLNLENISDLDLDSISAPTIDNSFADFDLADSNSLELVAAPTIDNSFADFDLADSNNLELVTAPTVNNSFADFDLADSNSLELVATSTVDNSFADFDLADSNSLELVAAPTIDNSFTDFDLADSNSLELVAAPTVDNSFADFDLANSNNLELIAAPTVDNSFADFDLADSNNLELIAAPTVDSGFAQLNLENISNLELIAAPTVDSGFAQLNLENISNLDLITASTVDNNFDDFELADSNSLDLIAAPTVDNSFAEFDFADSNSLDLIAASTVDNNFDDFELADSNSLDSIAAPIVDSGFAQLNLENISDLDSIADPTVDSSFADFDLNLSGNSSIQLERDFSDLNLEMISAMDSQSSGDIELSGDISSCDLADFDLLDIGNSNSSGDIATLQVKNSANERDFADLNLDEIGDLDSGMDLSLQLGDISDLDVDLSSHQFLDLEQMVGNNPEPKLNELGDLDSLLLGTAAIGIGAALLSTGGSGFDDLDALVGTSTPAAIPESSLNDLDSLLAPTKPTEVPIVPKSTKKAADRRSKQRTFEQTMRVSVSHLNNLNNLVGELVVNRNTLEQDQNRMRQFIEKLFSEVQRLNEVGKRMQDLYERSLMENSLIASRQQSKAASVNPSAVNAENLDSMSFMEYDPLEMDRFTPIHLLSQKMIELTVRIRESTSDIEFVVDGSTEVTRTLRQITGQLQEDLTKSRMIPFAQTADRLQRGVRENGLKYGKQVELEIEGRDTLIDKVILESLTDPLIHMVNNAIAHGIESPQTRQEFDKSPLGKISIRALHQGNQTIISVSDDGAGINTEIVKSKAIQKGIITAKQAATMTKPEVYELLFLPSFSTKDQADELAGRGVGMDVVRTSLAEIRGTISTESQVGLGSTFTIRLPLALSIAKALIAIDNKTNIAFPMDGIEDTQDVSPEQIQKNNQGENCIFWRDSLMPFKPLSELLGFNRPLPRNNFYSTQEDDTDLVSILILRSDGNLIAVQVDKITGEQEIAIKPLQGPASKPVGIAGATVMGDGRIIPIADVMELIDLAKGKITRHISTKWAMDMPAPTTQRQESMVLIVDDSITVRELLSLTFKRAGYRVEQARDGQEAWDKLRAGLPCDIVFCDIEMPRMDGLEFLSRVQKDPALSKVPVAMLTSRGSDRHRQIAAQLGASGYFIKPYLEEALLHAAKRMIEGEVLAIV